MIPQPTPPYTPFATDLELGEPKPINASSGSLPAYSALSITPTKPVTVDVTHKKKRLRPRLCTQPVKKVFGCCIFIVLVLGAVAGVATVLCFMVKDGRGASSEEGSGYTAWSDGAWSGNADGDMMVEPGYGGYGTTWVPVVEVVEVVEVPVHGESGSGSGGWWETVGQAWEDVTGWWDGLW